MEENMAKFLEKLKEQMCIRDRDLIEKCPSGGKVAILESPAQNSVNDRIRCV